MPYSDPEKRRAYQRDYIKRTWQRHLEQSREAMRRWRVNNPAARLARDRAYRERHPEQQNAYLEKYRRAHPEIRKVVDAARRARKALAGGRFSAQEWRDLLAHWQSRCAYCGIRAPLEADHRTPLARGGANSIANILPACGPCNRKKGSRTEEEFRASRRGGGAA